MATLLMNLRHVPDDEAEAVRALLSERGIDYYETPPNRWGISMGGIWLRDDERAEEVRQLLDDYQAERAHEARAAYERRLREGRAETLTGRLRRQPLQALLYTALIGVVLYVMLTPFFAMGQ